MKGGKGEGAMEYDGERERTGDKDKLFIYEGNS